jgi:hypothetical protein
MCASSFNCGDCRSVYLCGYSFADIRLLIGHIGQFFTIIFQVIKLWLVDSPRPPLAARLFPGTAFTTGEDFLCYTSATWNP